MHKTVTERVDALFTEEVLDACKKKLGDAIEPVWDNAREQILMDTEFNVSNVIRREIDTVIEALLAGDEKIAKYRLCLTYYTGRSHYTRDFVPDPIEMRRKIFEANRDLIVDARVDDLEALVENLREEIAKKDAALSKYRSAHWT